MSHTIFVQAPLPSNSTDESELELDEVGCICSTTRVVHICTRKTADVMMIAFFHSL